MIPWADLTNAKIKVFYAYLKQNATKHWLDIKQSTRIAGFTAKDCILAIIIDNYKSLVISTIHHKKLAQLVGVFFQIFPIDTVTYVHGHMHYSRERIANFPSTTK
jgi:hypothetical protein